MDIESIDLRDHAARLRRRWRVVAATAVFGLALALLTAYTQPVRYAATANVLIDSTAPQTPAAGGVLTSAEVATQMSVIASFPVATRVIQQLQLPYSAAKILSSLTVTPVTANAADATRVLSLQVTDASATRAARIANAFAQEYLSYQQDQAAKDAVNGQETLDQQVTGIASRLAALDRKLSGAGTTATRAALQTERQALLAQLTQVTGANATLASRPAAGGVILRPASVPATPAAPKRFRILALGAVIGLLLGVALAFIRDHVDDTVRDDGRLKGTLAGRPILARIPHVPKSRSDHVATLADPHSPASESYRTLSSQVSFLIAAPGASGHTGNDRPVLLVTSARPSEGKTFVAANLAVALSRVGLRVILVDADLRKPSLAAMFFVGEGLGLSDLVASTESANECLISVGLKNLRLLPSGSSTPNPTELLASPRISHVFEELRVECDIVIVDSAPLLSVADTLELMPAADHLVLVTRNGVSGHRSVAAAMNQVVQLGGTISGAVVNDVASEYDDYFKPFSSGSPGQNGISGQAGVAQRAASDH
jgi:capsular exopolysaccharide synthesis family protein